MEEKKQAREKRFLEAKETGNLIECGCCFGSDFLLEDMALCESGHKFCDDCVRLASAEIIGKDKLKFPCLSSAEKCEAVFSLRTLEKVLLKPVYENLVRRIQNDEVTRAFEASKAPNEELVSCPFCHYMTILANTHDSILTCLNDGCMKSSCRLCKEPSHIPLRCDEVEKKEQTDVRIQLENQMTEALLKSCWKCKRKFYKEEGCNHMTCTCGAQMCYVCGEPLKKIGKIILVMAKIKIKSVNFLWIQKNLIKEL